MNKKLIKHSILLCEDDVAFGNLLADYLQEKGFLLTYVHDGQEGWERFCNGSFDLVLTDIRMPRKNGIELIGDIRESESEVPILVLTALNSVEDIVKGYVAGADEYVIKPCAMEVLLCKIDAILRRSMRQEKVMQTEFKLDDLYFDYDNRRLSTSAGEHILSSYDAELLLLLLQAEGNLVERNRILKNIWQSDSHYASRSLNVYINRLRNNLKETPYIVQNVHGKGYKLVHR